MIRNPGARVGVPCTVRILDRILQHQFLDATNGLGGIEALGTDINTVHDGMTTKQLEGIIEFIQSALSILIAAIGKESV